MTRQSDWFRWIMMAVLACVAVYFFLFANQGVPLPPVPADGQIKDPALATAINKQIQSVNQSPADLGMRLKLCMIYDANGLETLASDCYGQLTELVPDHPRAWYHLAQLHRRQGKMDQAMIAMKQAASSPADTQLPNWQLGQMQLEAGLPEEALQSLENASEQLGSMPAFQVTMMKAQIEAGNPQAAIDLAERKALVNSNIGPYVHRLLADAHEQLGHVEEAQQARSMATDVVPSLSDSWMVEVAQMRADLTALKSRIAAAIQAQKWNEAINMIDLLRQYETPSRDIELMEVTCLAQTGSPEQGLQKIEQMMLDGPDDEQLILAKAAMQLQIGDLRNDPAQFELAIAAVEPILDANPADLRAIAIYLRGLRLLGRIDEALATCRAAWASQPQQIGPLLVAADLIRAHDAWAGNEDLLRSLWMSQPAHPTAGALLVLALVDEGRHEEATRILDGLDNASLDAATLNKARDAVHAARTP